MYLYLCICDTVNNISNLTLSSQTKPCSLVIKKINLSSTIDISKPGLSFRKHFRNGFALLAEPCSKHPHLFKPNFDLQSWLSSKNQTVPDQTHSLKLPKLNYPCKGYRDTNYSQLIKSYHTRNHVG